MEYLKICEVAKIWGLSERGVQSLCAQGKIEGATRFGRSWMIPKNAKKLEKKVINLATIEEDQEDFLTT